MSERPPLPVCRWRGQPTYPGRIACRSPLVQSGPYGIPATSCYVCPDCDHLDQTTRAEAADEAGCVRHLLFHLYPVHEWRRHVQALRARLSLFNGLRCVSLAIGPETAPRDEVAEAFSGFDARLQFHPNDCALKELTSYPSLLDQLLPYQGRGDVHFYAHGKSVCSSKISGFDASWRWTDAMYEALLDHWPAVRRELVDHAAVGIFRRLWAGPLRTRAKWHYSGSFRWVRNAGLFGRDWRAIDPHWLGSETHVGCCFGAGESACLYGEFSTQDVGLYLQSEWERWAEPRRQEWLKANAALRQAPLLTTVLLTAHRQRDLVKDAIASVRNQTTPDWQLLAVVSPEAASWPVWGELAGDARVSVFVGGDTPAVRAQFAAQGYVINKAMQSGRVRGDLIAVLSDDDMLDPQWLAAVQDLARQRPQEQAWYGRGNRVAIAPNGQVLERPGLRTVGVLDAGNSGRCRVDGGQVVVRRSAWSPWPQDLALAPVLDGYWIDQVAERNKIYPVEVLSLLHRHTPGSTFTQS